MLSRLRAHLTYVNAVATICLFVVLGGGAYAASTLPNNSVGTEQIERGGVTKPDIAEDAVGPAEIREGAVKSSEVRDGSLKCMDFDDSDICDPAASGGLTTTIVRSHVETVEMTCLPGETEGALDCSGAETVTASCKPGEVATGGSVTAPLHATRTSTVIRRDRPDPLSGVPTGWTGDAESFGVSNNTPPPNPAVTVFVVCAS
jgi:hypothetical protein